MTFLREAPNDFKAFLRETPHNVTILARSAPMVLFRKTVVLWLFFVRSTDFFPVFHFVDSEDYCITTKSCFSQAKFNPGEFGQTKRSTFTHSEGGHYCALLDKKRKEEKVPGPRLLF